jgi:hypothetical protein
MSLTFHFFFFTYNNSETNKESSSRSSTPHMQQQIPNHHQTSNINHNHVNSRSKRYSTPGYSDYGCNKVNMRQDNGQKISKRSIRSMNETVEVLADQVEEETYVSESFNSYSHNSYR